MRKETCVNFRKQKALCHDISSDKTADVPDIHVRIKGTVCENCAKIPVIVCVQNYVNEISPMKNRSSERACFKNQSSERVRFEKRLTEMYMKVDRFFK